MLRRESPDLSINQERWLVSYADFVTLLFAFFVVMYSVSQLNESKYQALSETLTELFSEVPVVISESNQQSSNESTEDLTEQHNTFPEIVPLPSLSDQFKERFSDLITKGDISVTSNELWLQVSLKDKVLFSTGSVVPSSQAASLFAEIADILVDTDNPIQVEGFTDNVPIKSAQFPSNWELSTARASAIVKLLAGNGVPPKNLSAVGYGEFQPIADNSTQEGREQNRRVTLMIANAQRKRPEVVLDPEPIIEDKVSPNISSSVQDQRIKPVTLENGELLFSSDPDLPRR